MFICINLTNNVLHHILGLMALYPENLVAFTVLVLISILVLDGFLFYLDIFEHVYGGKLSHGVR
jgi:hypothetical protein